MLQENKGNYLATKILEPLSKYYLQENIEEIAINREQEVWIKPKRAPWKPYEAPEISYEYIKKMCRVLANINKAKFSEQDMPIVSCQLPNLPFRFQAIVGPNVSYNMGDNRGVGIAIRSLTPDDNINFGAYGLTENSKLDGALAFLKETGIDKGNISKIQEMINKHMTIIVAGATSTGKTTFTNKLIQMIPEDERIITVEDTRELQVAQPNHLHLRVERNSSTNNVGYNQILNVLMRMTPDWIICGELSVENALPIYSLMGKGHPIITTVHAGSPDEAIRAFINNMASAGSKLDPESTTDNLKAQIGCIIQIDRRDGERKVVDIVFPMQEIAQENNKIQKETNE